MNLRVTSVQDPDLIEVEAPPKDLVRQIQSKTDRNLDFHSLSLAVNTMKKRRIILT